MAILREPNREALVADSQSSFILARANYTPAAPRQFEGAKRMSACYSVFCFSASGLFFVDERATDWPTWFRGRGDAKFSVQWQGGRPLAGPLSSRPCSAAALLLLAALQLCLARESRAPHHTTTSNWRTWIPGSATDRESRWARCVVRSAATLAAVRWWIVGLCAVENGRLEWPFWVVSGVHGVGCERSVYESPRSLLSFTSSLLSSPGFLGSFFSFKCLDKSQFPTKAKPFASLLLQPSFFHCHRLLFLLSLTSFDNNNNTNIEVISSGPSQRKVAPPITTKTDSYLQLPTSLLSDSHFFFPILYLQSY